METRLGSIVILVNSGSDTGRINEIISDHAEMILGRQGIPLRGRGKSIISLVIEGSTNEFGSLSGKLGRLEGVKVKSLLIS